jgi:hypothetical protein
METGSTDMYRGCNATDEYVLLKCLNSHRKQISSNPIVDALIENAISRIRGYQSRSRGIFCTMRAFDTRAFGNQYMAFPSDRSLWHCMYRDLLDVRCNDIFQMDYLLDIPKLGMLTMKGLDRKLKTIFNKIASVPGNTYFKSNTNIPLIYYNEICKWFDSVSLDGIRNSLDFNDQLLDWNTYAEIGDYFQLQSDAMPLIDYNSILDSEEQYLEMWTNSDLYLISEDGLKNIV